MGKFRAGRSLEQVTFLPRSLDEYVSAQDSVRFIDALIEELDLTEIEKRYSSLGRPAFSPRIITKVILYGKIRGIRSCRELARAVRENVKFMFLARDEKPDFRTINLFRKKFYKELSGLLGQTVHIALNEGMLSLEHVAIDGTRIKGYASKGSYYTPSELEQLLQQIEQEIKDSFEEDIEKDSEVSDDEPTLPPDLRQKINLRHKVQESLRVYRSMTEQGTRKQAPKKISITDPDCRYLPVEQIPTRCYNLQAAVDSKSRIVVGGYVINGSDNSQVIPMLNQVEKNTAGRLPREISADSGYSDQKSLRILNQKGVTGFVSQIITNSPRFTLKDFVYEQDTDSYRCPNGSILSFRQNKSDRAARVYKAKAKNCNGCAFRARCIKGRSSRILTVSDYRKEVDQMLTRTQSLLGKEKRALRAATIEPLFAHLKHAKNLSRLFFRGKAMLDSFWKLELAAVNLDKIIRFRINKFVPA